jgi:RNA ligase
LPEGYALQWETCGPKIQGNPSKLKEILGFAFSAYDICRQEYLDWTDFKLFCEELKFPTVQVLDVGTEFNPKDIERWAMEKAQYNGGGEREGVVIRSACNWGKAPVSFKVINLNYEK